MPAAAPVPTPSEWCVSAHHRNRLLLSRAHKMTVPNSSPSRPATHIPHLVSPVSKVVTMANWRHWECWLRWKLYQIHLKFSVAERSVSTGKRNGDRHQSEGKPGAVLPLQNGTAWARQSRILPLTTAQCTAQLFCLWVGSRTGFLGELQQKIPTKSEISKGCTVGRVYRLSARWVGFKGTSRSGTVRKNWKARLDQNECNRQLPSLRGLKLPGVFSLLLLVSPFQSTALLFSAETLWWVCWVSHLCPSTDILIICLGQSSHQSYLCCFQSSGRGILSQRRQQ